MTRGPAIVGAFILGAIGVCIFAILFFGGMHWFTKTTQVVVFFRESVAGLDVGAPVTFHGARIGSVRRIAIRVSANSRVSTRIPVVLDIDPNQVTWEGDQSAGQQIDYQRLVQAGLRAQLALQSLITGQLRVDLEFLPNTPAELVGTAEGLPEIPPVPSNFGRLLDEVTGVRLRELADSAERAFAALARLSDHLDAKVEPLTEDVHHTLDAATRTLQMADEAIQQVQAEASSTLHDFDLLVTDSRRQLTGRAEELSRALVTINRAARQADTLIGSLNGLVEPRSQFRSDLEATVRDLAASASSLRGFARMIERDPSLLLKGNR